MKKVIADIAFKTLSEEKTNKPIMRVEASNDLRRTNKVLIFLCNNFLRIKLTVTIREKHSPSKLIKKAANVKPFALYGFVLNNKTRTRPVEIRSNDIKLKFNI